MALTAATLAVVMLPAAPAHADEVRVVSGPGTAASESYLTYVNCDDFFAPALPPRTRINLGPSQAPLGRRSMGLVPPGPDTASGPMTRFSSLSGLSAGLSVSASRGTTGASYIWALTADAAPGTAWLGRATLGVPAGAWQLVDAAAVPYTWQLVDLATRLPVEEGGQGKPAEFAAAHGDGAGYVVTGFGCDGQPFNVDAVRGGGVVYDYEGISLSTGISSSAVEVAPGDTVTLSGTVRDGSGRLMGDPLRLEKRTPGGAWVPVGAAELVDPDAVTRVELTVEETTEFRWHRPDSQYADEGWSGTVTVRVGEPLESEPKQPKQPEPPQPDPPEPETVQSEPEAPEPQTTQPEVEPSKDKPSEPAADQAAEPSAPASAPATEQAAQPSAPPTEPATGQAAEPSEPATEPETEQATEDGAQAPEDAQDNQPVEQTGAQ